MQVIYRFTSPSGAVYIGQTNNLKRRMCSYRKLKCRSQRRLYASLKKHGFENHQLYVVHTFPYIVDQSVIDEYERYVMVMHRVTMRCRMLNLTEGGRGNAHGVWPKRRNRRVDMEGENHRSAKLTAVDVQNIRAVYARGKRWRGIRQLARYYMVSERLIYNVVNRISWKHLPAARVNVGAAALRRKIEKAGRCHSADLSRKRFPKLERIQCAAVKSDYPHKQCSRRARLGETLCGIHSPDQIERVRQASLNRQRIHGQFKAA